MPNPSLSSLELLILSLTKAEKRFFKLQSTRLKGSEDALFIKLFDWIDKRKKLEEALFLKKNPNVKNSQLSNLKAHLHKQLLQSLRILNPDKDLDLVIRNHVDHSILLYNKCLYHDSLKQLRKAKKLAVKNDKTILLLQILEIEKKLALKLIRPDMEKKTDRISRESEQVQQKIGQVYQFSNLFNRLYAHYVHTGYIRNSEEFERVSKQLKGALPSYEEKKLSSDEKMYLYSALVCYYYFIQDYTTGLAYSKKWVQLFEEEPGYRIAKIDMYLKGINNLITGYYKLNMYNSFVKHCRMLDEIYSEHRSRLTVNIRLQLFKYLSTHELNRYFLEGKFREGVTAIPKIAQELKRFEGKMDLHHQMIFYYKFVCMHFGADQYKEAVQWLNLIINNRDFDLRSDIQGFARILNLICHYELGNEDLVEYSIRSTYRFLIKKEEVNLYQRHILSFLRQLPFPSSEALQEGFLMLLRQMKELKRIPFERRAFTYFDIISWLESKIDNRPVEKIIQKKASRFIHKKTMVQQ